MFKLKNIKNIFLSIVNDTYKQLSSLGSYQFFLIIIGIFFFKFDFKNTIFLTICFILIKIICIPIRLIFFKNRPNKEKYKNWFEKLNASSMPSLHSVRITVLLLFFIRIFHYNLYIIAFLTIIGYLIIYSRIYRKRHYPIDAIVGIIIGFIIYFIIYFSIPYWLLW